MGRRTILLIAALVVAALGTALVWMYANRAEEAALAGQEPVQVLVATTNVAAGTTGAAISEAGTAELRNLPASSVPAGALSDLTPVAGQVAVSTIFEGQVLLAGMFGSVQQSGGGLTLPEGAMAVSVSLGDPQRVAGFVQPGSEVAIFVTVAGVGGGGGDEEAEAAAAVTQTAALLERVPVVAVGPTTVSATTTTDGQTSNTEQIPTAILTLALDQAQAQRLIQATAEGQLYFALLNDESQIDPDLPGTTTENLLG
jgi:pilus assembly protein CpaB